LIAQLDRAAVRARPGLVPQRLLAWALFEGRPVTTRGRFLNPLVGALARLLVRLPIEARAGDRPIFVLGTGRSGTTWLGRTLALHRSLALLNEPKALWHVACPGQDVIGSYERAAGRLNLAATDATPQVARRARRLHGAYARICGAARVLDKYPEMIFRVDFLRAIFPEARFLVTLREGAATARSIAAWSERHGRYTNGRRHDWWGVDDRKWHALVDERVPGEADLAPASAALRALEDGLARAALEWVVTTRVALELGESPDVRLVRLETLAAAPVEELRAILAWCGLADDPVLLEYARGAARPAPSAPALDLDEPLASAFARTQAALESRSIDPRATPQ
jgi:hypothetical protein